MKMDGYSYIIKENEDSYAKARVEDVDASFKDLAEVCGRVNNLTAERAFELLNDFSTGEKPVLYKSHNKRLGHRKELMGQKGRYPKKSAAIVLKLLRSVVANAMGKGMIEPYIIVHASANKKRTYPRTNPKGRRGRSDYETARVEIVIREKEIVKKEKKKKPEKNAEEEKPKIKSEEKKVEKEVTKEKPIEKKDVNDTSLTEIKTTEKKTEIKKDKPKEKPIEKKDVNDTSLTDAKSKILQEIKEVKADKKIEKTEIKKPSKEGRKDNTPGDK